ncbi:MAG: CoA transferase [Myxococcales bacterium]|nr:CoA transferase [Myxococcales bacterium]
MTERRPVVLSVEQALSMSYATLRFAHLGWRVIRIEPTPSPGQRTRGDPNRHIGRKVAEGDRHSYFVGPNCGKEAIALNLKEPDGQALLARLIRELRADVFCTNTMPARHASLGIDYASLSKLRPELVWCCISAMGLAYPNVPGYDPVLQAQCGYMDVTGYPDGPPMQNGPPLIDLKAGDEAFAQVLWAMLERHRTGAGRAIDVSMAQVATSWLLTFLPMLDMGSPPEELKRSGNEHRQFIPTNAYPTADGFIYLAVGSDVQWQRLVAEAPFRSLDRPDLATNEGRRRDKTALHAAIGALTSKLTAAEVALSLRAAQIPHAPITPIERVMDQEFLKDALLRTQAPDGKSIRLPPPAVSTEFLESRDRELRFAPAYGEHTDGVLGEVGVPADEVAALRERGVVA